MPLARSTPLRPEKGVQKTCPSLNPVLYTRMNKQTEREAKNVLTQLVNNNLYIEETKVPNSDKGNGYKEQVTLDKVLLMVTTVTVVHVCVAIGNGFWLLRKRVQGE